jgi:hypothetical protein
MFGNWSGAPKQEPGKMPGPDDFKSEAVAKAVLKETLEHPATIYPAAGSALALGWTFIIAASPTSVAITLGCAFVSASAFIYNYVVKGPDFAAAHIAKLRELRKAQRLAQLDLFEQECLSAGLTEGEKESKELKAAYENLTAYLKTHKDGVSVERFQVLAEDTLQQGVSVLQQALAIFTAVQSIDVTTLQREIEGWRRQRTALTDGSPKAKALDLQIDAHMKQIELYNKRENDLAQLFAQVNEIESALQSTYLELVDLGSRNSSKFLAADSDAASRLQTAVDVARRVEQRLRGEDSEDEEKKKKYIQAYQQQQVLNSNDQKHYEEK